MNITMAVIAKIRIVDSLPFTPASPSRFDSRWMEVSG
jgi:hypothetical protein